MIATITKNIDALHEAPLADPYINPTILKNHTTGVFFHEVFDHRIKNHQQKKLTSNQTFASYVGKNIAPD